MSLPIMLHSLTLRPRCTLCAASATLWPTPPMDWVIPAGFEVYSTGVTGLGSGYLSLWKLQLRSRATDPATKMSALDGLSFTSGSPWPSCLCARITGGAGLKCCFQPCIRGCIWYIRGFLLVI